MSKRRISYAWVAALVVVAAILNGCISPQRADQIFIIDQRQVQGVPVIKTLQANNCKGAQEMRQDLQALLQYTHDISVVPDPGVTVNSGAVADEIRAYYRIPAGPEDAICVVPVVIPAGAFYSYDIEWVEVWREGIFEMGKTDGKEEGTYRVKESMLCEVVAQRTETCPAQ